MVSTTRAYNWYISLVAASCMVLYGYDASVFNALQNSDNWKAYFNKPGPNIIGAINTAYTVGAVVAGFFMVRYYSEGNNIKHTNVSYRAVPLPILPVGERVWLLERYV